MKIFIGHKFQNVNKKLLREKIERIASVLEEKGYQTFNYLRDRENWEPKNFLPGRVIKETLEEVKNSDVFLVFIDGEEKSEGIFLEFGVAKSLGKKTILLISDKISSPTLEAISDQVIRFVDWEDAGRKLSALKV